MKEERRGMEGESYSHAQNLASSFFEVITNTQLNQKKNLLFSRKDFVEGALFSAPSYISANRRRDSMLQISFCHKEGYILGLY